MDWVERNIVPDVSLDRYGRRRAVRVFSLYGGTISESTAHDISKNPQNYRNSSNQPLPAIGEKWQTLGTDLTPLTLDFYTVQVNANEIIATANYSTDFDETGIEFSYQNVLVNIPFAVKVPTGQASNQSAGGLAYAWQLNNLSVVVAQPRLTISKKLHLTEIDNVHSAVRSSINGVYLFRITNATNASRSYWKFEGASVTQLGPEGLQVRYQFVSDPGNVTINWPSILNDTTQYVLPRQSTVFPPNGTEWVRPPFHEVKILPPDPPPGNVYNTSQPLPPKFTAIPTAIIGDGVNPGYDEPGGRFPALPGVPLPIRVTTSPGGGG